jgi:4-hydroxy-3-methylbut-2-enyl diphosphate reductase
MKTVYYLTPSSFCFGVKRSIDQLNGIIEKHPDEKIFCVHALVHNPKVTKEFEQQGVIFVEHMDDIVHNNAIVVFSAHGTNREVIEQAKQKFKAVYNLECPFVSKIYSEVDGFIQKGVTTFFYVGKEHHQEGKNILAYIESQG